jgi:glycosyltransferase involved in cell wall biosynthesis
MPASSGSSPRIAYLTTQYPSVSHTFIRREIRGLEAMGYTVQRLAIRPGGAAVDPEDQEEATKTFHCLAQPKAKLLLRAALGLAKRPGAAIGALRCAVSMGKRSDRGVLKHLAYLLEAAVLLDEVERFGARHVHVHFGTNAAAVARLMRKLGGPTYSMMIHGPDEFDAAIGLSLGDKMIDAAFTAAITDYCGAQLRRWIPYEEWHKVRVVHCTVGPTWLDQDCPVPEDTDGFVCVGRLAPQKGQLILVEAFAEARREMGRGHLTLVGDGEMRGIIEERIAALGLADHVTITGWQTEAEVRDHLKQGRALALASFAEGLPVVIMEALAMERPVVATTIMGIPELVVSGENGWLAPAGSVPLLADAMTQALNTPVARLREMGAAGATRVKQDHFTETEVAKLDALFREFTDVTREGAGA